MKYKHLLITLLLPWSAQAGPLSPPAPPNESAMYSIGDLCNRLDTGAPGTKKTFTAPTSGPGATGCTLNEVMSKAPAKDNANAAQPSEVTAGKKYWGLSDSHWGLQTGTATSPLSPTPVAKTGQTTSYRQGDDGSHQKGVSVSPRFTDNGNGTVTDNLTGLIWLKNANCAESRMNWTQAMNSANSLANGICGLSDGSKAGDWRLPKRSELHSLIDYSQYDPALPSGHPFTGVVSSWYWSSTTYTGSTSSAWYVYLNGGRVDYGGKANTGYVWAVRGGQ